MNQRRLQRVSGQAQARALQLADRAGDYVQEHARSVSEQVTRLTGRSMDSWTRDARRYARHHPLQAIALTVGLGFVLGKVLARH
jgi:ElaB/YqjD/DUF883 family membrane-anchored ribosome-binding protein